jgi:hypothetical protein
MLPKVIQRLVVSPLDVGLGCDARGNFVCNKAIEDARVLDNHVSSADISTA